jgi:hypothetical protein
MSEDQSDLPPEIINAYREAKARGLPDGWTCSIDVREILMPVLFVNGEP